MYLMLELLFYNTVDRGELEGAPVGFHFSCTKYLKFSFINNMPALLLNF